MAPIHKVTPSTLRAVQDGLETGHDEWESVGVPAGDIGVECDRAVWLAFRRASVPEVIDWKKRRIFERGDIEETRLLDLLRMIGCEVSEQQARVRGAGGHLRGKIDGQVLGLPEAMKTIHVVECKSSNATAFRYGQRQRQGCQPEALRDHAVLYVQAWSRPRFVHDVLQRH